MRIKKLNLRTIAILIACGLIIISVFSLLMEHFRFVSWDNDNQPIVSKLQSIIPSRANGYESERSNKSMSVIEIDGNDYIGLLDIPQYEITLPLLASYDEKCPEKRPARFWGSVYDSSLIIALNYSKKMKFLTEMDIGTRFVITDLSGKVYSYSVQTIRHLNKIDTTTLLSSEGDLTVFFSKDMQHLIVSFELAQ